MKKLFIFAILMFSCANLFNFNPALAKADKVIYAKIQEENIFIYSLPSENENNKLFILPQSYFVKLINEANDQFYYCSYKDINGYVKKSQVVPMSGTPVHPYVEGLFRTFSLEGQELYSSPYLNTQKCLATIPYLTDNLVYYGTLLGQEVIPDKGKEWIYCKYTQEEAICGYVYSVFCDKVPKITTNNENFEIITSPFSNTQKPQKLSSVAIGFIIAGVAIPCLVVLFLLIQPTLNKEKLNTLKPKLRAKRNRDYFEFDDSDLN